MLKIMIVDDEPDARNTLVAFIRKYYSNGELVGEASGVSDAISLLDTRKPDVLLLDIKMADGTGFDLLEKVQQDGFDVIFTTAYDQYALKAIKYSAVDYLLKPIDSGELINALTKVEDRKNARVNVSDKSTIHTLLNNLKNPSELRLAIPDGKGISYIHPNKIIAICSNDNFCTVFIDGQEQLVVIKALKEFEAMLSEEEFYRIHNTCIVNLNYVNRYIKGDGGNVVMSDNSEYEVSRRRKNEFLEILNSRSRK